ncbi:Penicillin-binding protein PbpB [Microbacterium ginsengisoli]|jgi:cell division protein FtsI (penicillin-binding protein 3)|uniref:Penicillin-binding protein PbpB n=1 Tax=Microbacterium ginsengisoli TaxID=400772 RepID=A0A0F0LZW3_9MICO|nr:penicillin-binding protein 2 [Microbacterium ginsengisoli]KJL36941.1 Penicillin-binding protein PbpB [Microbacterium ginsengisoli]
MTSRNSRSTRRRTVVGFAIVLAVLAVFTVRLVDIQVVNADANVQQAMTLGYGVERTVNGTRGSIVDMYGNVLAGTVTRYDVQIDPSTTSSTVSQKQSDGTTASIGWSAAAAQIASILGKTPADVEKVVSDALAVNPKSQYAILAKAVDTDAYTKLSALGLPYLSFPTHPVRTYPDGAVAGNLVGFVGSDEQALAGLELSQQSCLQQTNGVVRYQRGKDGVMIPGTEETTPAVDGGTVTLTIDRDLQWYMQQLIAEQVQKRAAVSGTITVVDIKTGDIRAAAEYPTVDPNNINATAPEYWRSHIFTDTFEPGSTFKALTASMLIDSGTSTATSTASVPGRITFPNGATVVDDSNHRTELYTLAGVLMDSSNVGASILGSQLAPDVRYGYLQKFGIGQGSAVGFIGEAKGDLPPVSAWDRQKIYDTTYGQGLTTTVPELLTAYMAIANGGEKIPLKLVQSCTASDGTVTTPAEPAATRVMSTDAAQQVTDILENVATQGPLAKAVSIPGYVLAFKTGTGQQYDAATGGYKVGAYFTTLIGFAPADNPQYLVAITLNEPQTITSSAANAEGFQKAMTQVLKTYRVLPDDAQPVTLPKFG